MIASLQGENSRSAHANRDATTEQETADREPAGRSAATKLDSVPLALSRTASARLDSGWAAGQTCPTTSAESLRETDADLP